MAEFPFPELAELHEEYQAALRYTPEHPVEVMYNEDVQKDKVATALKEMSADISDDEKRRRLEKARSKFISPEEAALNKAGFAGSAAKLFSKYVELDGTDLELEKEDIVKKLAILAVVPSEQQKGATITSDGYYYGGHFNPVGLESDS